MKKEASFAGGAVARVQVVDGRLVDLEFRGLENFGLDGLVDGAEMTGGGVGPSVECLSPDVDIVSPLEALGLAVVREVVLVFVGDDLSGERGC